MQEVISFIVFSVFSVLFLQVLVSINHAIDYSPIAVGAFFVFKTPL